MPNTERGVRGDLLLDVKDRPGAVFTTNHCLVLALIDGWDDGDQVHGTKRTCFLQQEVCHVRDFFLCVCGSGSDAEDHGMGMQGLPACCRSLSQSTLWPVTMAIR